MNLSDPDVRRVLGAFVNVPSNNEGRIEAVLERMWQDFEATKGPLTPWSALNLQPVLKVIGRGVACGLGERGGEA